MATEMLARAGISASGELWDPQLDDTLVCIDIHAETHDVKSFTFVSPDRKQFAFSAGQYFLFDLGPGDGDASRCYSISSSPLRKNAITITVKRVPGGKVSNWLHDTLAQNAVIRARGPLGRFVRPAAKKYLFLSAGSGITPLMSMARELADTAEPTDVIFVHAGRSPQDLIFRKELANLASRIKGFRLHLLPEDIGTQRCWPGLSGRISREFLALAVPDMAERVIMCCGPAPFMAAARNISAELGVPPSNYYEESFDAAATEAAPVPNEEVIETKSFRVHFSKQNKSIDVRADQTVLSCARKSTVRIPSSCANGICGTCKSRLTSGIVDMKHDGGIRQREIEAGFFLPCCSKPLSDLVIDR